MIISSSILFLERSVGERYTTISLMVRQIAAIHSYYYRLTDRQTIEQIHNLIFSSSSLCLFLHFRFRIVFGLRQQGQRKRTRVCVNVCVCRLSKWEWRKWFLVRPYTACVRRTEQNKNETWEKNDFMVNRINRRKSEECCLLSRSTTSIYHFCVVVSVVDPVAYYAFGSVDCCHIVCHHSTDCDASHRLLMANRCRMTGRS